MPSKDIQPAPTFEQRREAYRDRIRTKLQAAAVAGDELERQTEELMNRRTGFDLTSLRSSEGLLADE